MKVDMHSHKSKHKMAAIPSFCTVGWERHGWDCTSPGSVLTNSQDMASPALKLFRCKSLQRTGRPAAAELKHVQVCTVESDRHNSHCPAGCPDREGRLVDMQLHDACFSLPEA